MKLNNKGFAISSVMYSLLILAVSLMFGILAILISRKITLDKIKDNVRQTVNGEVINIPDEYRGILAKVYQPGEAVAYAGLSWLVVKDNGNNVTLVLNDKIAVSNNKYSSYKTELNNFINNNSVLSIAKKNNYIRTMTFTGGTDTVRTLEFKDIYGNVTPTQLGIDQGIVENCLFCISDYDYYLLNASGNDTYKIVFDAANVVNYLDKGSGAGNVRPVITVNELN